MQDPSQPARAALVALILVQAIMLAALFAGVPPHPPASIAPFAMAPFLAASIAAASAALMLDPFASPGARVLTGLAVLMALVSFGPQKIVDPAFPQIWPAVLTAWVAIAGLLISAWYSRAKQPK